MRRSWRNKFDLERDFVVRRKVTLGGVTLSPGDAFDKSLVPVRRVRQLYDQRIIMFAGDLPGAIMRSPNDHRRRRHGDADLEAGQGGAARLGQPTGAHIAEHAGRIIDAHEAVKPFLADLEEATAAEIEAQEREDREQAERETREQILTERAAIPIPTDWAKLKWPDKLSLAASVSDTPIRNGKEAAAAVEAELARRGAS